MPDRLRDEVDLALINALLTGVGGKAHFDPNQPRDPHTGRWMTIGMALSADDLGEVLDAMTEMRDGGDPSPLESRLIDARHAGGRKMSLTVPDLDEMIDALANARDAFNESPSKMELRLISARQKLKEAQDAR